MAYKKDITPIAKRDENTHGALAHLMETLTAIAKPQINWEHEKPEIEYVGKKITLPNDPAEMPIDEAVKALQRLKKDEEEVLQLIEVITCYPQEGLVAFVKAMEHLYGWASPVATPTFFGPKPPTFVSIQTDVDQYTMAPWGSFKIPGIKELVTVDAGYDNKNQPFFRAHCKAVKKERKILQELAALTRQILAEESIYRGKALHIRGTHRLDMDNPPEFIDVRKVDLKQLIFNKDVQEQIETSVYAVIKHTQQVRDASIPIKRGVLLEGKYGVGKTLASRATAKLCVENGWTFITVDRAEMLQEALNFARRYQPAAVFCEDIDRAMSERSNAANDLLNTVDGIISKNSEVMVVLTTNHIEKIEQAMLRPGRLDAVITITPPDAEAVERLIRLYSRNLLKKGETLMEVGAELAGTIPSVIREVVERSKLAMIAQGETQLTEHALLVSAKGMKNHMALLAPKDEKKSVEQRLGEALGELVIQSTEGYDPEDRDIAKESMQGAYHRDLARKSDSQSDKLDQLGELTSEVKELAESLVDAFGGIKRVKGKANVA